MHNRGAYAERSFSVVAERNRWSIEPSTNASNIHHHIDYTITKNATSYTVDVKSMKTQERSRGVIQDAWHVLEFIAVTYPSYRHANFSPPFNPLSPDFSRGSGRAGWLYGNADLVAFEHKTIWLFVERKKLISLAAELIDFDTVAKNARSAQYTLYSRPKRGDLISYIHSYDLYSIRRGIWKK